MKNILMKLPILALVFATGLALWAQQPAAVPQSSAPQSQVQKDVEHYLRHTFALGPDIQVAVGSPKEYSTSGLMEVNIDVTTPEGNEKVKMFVSRDGRYLFRGEVSDLTKDELAEARAKMDLQGAPVLGDPNAPITIVEYSDFECPVCRNLHDALRGLLPNYPQVKLVFKDYPIQSIHPWARTAALAGRCAYQQNPKVFWKMYDLIYDNQDLLSAGSIYDKAFDYAGQAGLNQDTFKSCLTSPQANQEVDASIANGNSLDVHSTPTLFINGRRLVGADPRSIQNSIDYEMVALAGKNGPKK